MKKILLLCCIGLFQTTDLAAQYSYSSGGAFTFGVQSFPTDEFAAFYPQAPSLPSAHFSFGGYGVWQINRFMLGFKGAGIYSSEENQGNFSYRAQGGYWSLDLGYKVINRDKFGLYPVIGLGYGGLTYTMASTEDVDLLPGGTTPMAPLQNNGSYNWNGFLLDIGFRVEHLFGFKERNGGKGGGTIGLEAGYMFAPASDNWETSGGGAVLNAPDYAMNGYFVRLLIGGMGGK